MEYRYDSTEPVLNEVCNEFLQRLGKLDKIRKDETGEHLYEHVVSRIKSDESMQDKLIRKKLPLTCVSTDRTET